MASYDGGTKATSQPLVGVLWGRVKHDDTTYFLGRETLIVGSDSQLPMWQARLFATMSRNARNAAMFFRLPPGRIVEVGVQIEV